MGTDRERTGDKVESDPVEIGPEGDTTEPASDVTADTASDAGPDTVQGVVGTAGSGGVVAA